MIYHGDCFEWLQHIDNESVDMCYIDPPFFTQRDFGQFNDKWKSKGEYLTYMELRLIEIHRVLKDTGSIFLHCDHHMSHHLRILLDEVFGEKNFRNEIVWCYRGGAISKKCFGKKHDLIFWYSKGSDWVFNVDEVRVEYSIDTQRRYRSKLNNIRKGVDYGEQSMHPKGKHPEDWITMQPIMGASKERTGYPTQKPEKLLERIIKCSTNKGDTVLDCFMGSGTTLAVAQKLKRKWIGGDINKEAIKIAKKRLDEIT